LGFPCGQSTAQPATTAAWLDRKATRNPQLYIVPSVSKNIMKEILQTIIQLRKELEILARNEGKILEGLYDKVNSLTDFASHLENLWIGGWGQPNFNHYQNPYNQDEYIQVNEEYFYSLIRNDQKIDINKIEKEIFKNIKAYKKFQQKIITELSLIRDKENFNNENELLRSIELFKWGFDIQDFVNLKRPSQIPIYDMHELSKGLKTPPHIFVMSFIVSLTTKSFSVRNFEESAYRLLRQVELKFNTKSNSDDSVFSDIILTQIFNNFHSFCNQLKDRHKNRSSVVVDDEYDVQDLLHSILKLHFQDVRPEENAPSFGGRSARMDFLLKNENIVIEVKKTREKLGDNEITEQLILDVAYYKNHPNCNHLKCFVYDPENRVKNPRGIERDLSKLTDDSLTVELFIRP